MAEIGFGFPSESGLPIGVVLPFFGDETDVPRGWLLCDGRKFSVGQYSKLAAQLSRASGTYTDTTPDLRGRIPVGKDNMGGTSANRITGSWADSFGGSGGAENHTLTTGEMPSHGHNFNYSTTGASGGAYFSGNSVGVALHNTTNTTATGSVAAAGSGNAHNNVQPSMAMNYIIKAA